MIKKIEITKLIDEKLTEYPIRYTDLMNKTYSINSYEKYIQEFSLKITICTVRLSNV